MDHLRFCSKGKCVTCRHAEVCILTNKSAGTDSMYVCFIVCVISECNQGHLVARVCVECLLHHFSPYSSDFLKAAETMYLQLASLLIGQTFLPHHKKLVFIHSAGTELQQINAAVFLRGLSTYNDSRNQICRFYY